MWTREGRMDYQEGEGVTVEWPYGNQLGKDGKTFIEV